MIIAGYDNLCMDLNVFCEKMPQKGELVEINSMSLMGGGKVPNAIIAAARLGSDTRFICSYSEDRYGKSCIEDFRRHGVDVSYSVCRKGHSSFCISIIDDREHEKHYLQSFSTVIPLDEKDIRENMLDGVGLLMLYKIDCAAEKLIRFAKQKGIPVLVDGDEYDPVIEKNISKIDVLITSEYYYKNKFSSGSLKENLAEMSKEGPDVVVVTMGEKGCAGMEKGQFFEIPAYQVEAVDTTGAGDVFHGAFAHAYFTENMNAKEAARFASAVSAIKCTRGGGRTGIPTRKITENYMRTGDIISDDFDEREIRYENDAWR